MNISLADETVYYVSSYKGKDFRISSQPPEHSLYSEQFQFTLEHQRRDPKEIPYFIYSKGSSEHNFVTSALDLSDNNNFPLDVVALNNERVGRNSRKIYLMDSTYDGPMISLDGHGNVSCCREKVKLSFYAYNVTESGKRPYCLFCSVKAK